MRKLTKSTIIASLSSIFMLQTTACTDDSKFNLFTNNVAESKNNSSAFFGFLGSANDETSEALKTSFDYLNKKIKNEETLWTRWLKTKDDVLKVKKINTINLNYYQGPYNQDSSSDPISSFWNNKNSSWQRNIFNWVYNHTKEDNPNFKIPKGKDVTEIITKKDDKNNDMFTKLPIVFIISKGELITAGQNWINPNSTRSQQEDAIKEFVEANLLAPNF